MWVWTIFHWTVQLLHYQSKNYVLDNHKFSEESGFGLKSEADIFSSLNKHDCEDINPIIIRNEDRKFEVEFQVSKKLFEK